jgi:hypothetical protein
MVNDNSELHVGAMADHYTDDGKDEKMPVDIEAIPDGHDGGEEKSYASMYGHFEEVKHVKQGLHQRHIQMVRFFRWSVYWRFSLLTILSRLPWRELSAQVRLRTGRVEPRQ